KSRVHPITRRALLDPGKAHALHFKLRCNQGVQVCTADKDIAASGAGTELRQVQFTLQGFECCHVEKGDLPFVILFEAEKTVATNSLSSHTFDVIHLDDRVLAGSLAVMSEEVVAGRNS